MDLGLFHKKKAPVLWIRYEDLVTEPEYCLTQISKFLLNKNDISGTNAMRRVDEVANKTSKESM